MSKRIHSLVWGRLDTAHNSELTTWTVNRTDVHVVNSRNVSGHCTSDY